MEVVFACCFRTEFGSPFDEALVLLEVRCVRALVFGLGWGQVHRYYQYLDVIFAVNEVLGPPT